MSLLSRSDLRFIYSWSAILPDDPRISGKPNSTLLNRNEGYEVLYLINTFADLNSINIKKSGHKIERMIRNHLPGDIRKQEAVVNWINSNWEICQ
jgi:hypothetical protein